MINRFAALITILLLLLYYNFPTSCVFVLADSAADSPPRSPQQSSLRTSQPVVFRPHYEQNSNKKHIYIS